MANLRIKGPQQCGDCGAVIKRFEECYVTITPQYLVRITRDAKIERHVSGYQYTFECLPCGRKGK